MKIYPKVFLVLFILFKTTLCLAIQNPGIMIYDSAYNPYTKQFILVGRDEDDEAFVGTLNLMGGSNRTFMRHHLIEGKSPLMYVKVITAGPNTGYVELFSKNGVLFMTDPADMQQNQNSTNWKVTTISRDYLGARELVTFQTDQSKSPIAHNIYASYFIVTDPSGLTHVAMRFLGANNQFQVKDIFTTQNIASIVVTKDNTELMIETSDHKKFISIEETKSKAQAPGYTPSLVPLNDSCLSSNTSFTTRFRSGVRISKECFNTAGNKLELFQDHRPDGRVSKTAVLTETITTDPSKTQFGLFGDIPIVSDGDSEFSDVEMMTSRDDDELNISTTTLSSEGTPATPKQTQKFSTTLFPLCSAGGEVDKGRFIRIIAGSGNEILISETHNPETPPKWVKMQI